MAIHQQSFHSTLAQHGAPRVRRNFPLRLTTFVGREREVRELEQLLAECRLLTLTGTGGIGKTRLALEVSAGLSDMYANDIWLVELAALHEPLLVPQTVAVALGVREQPKGPLLATLVEAVCSRQMLLVLDNCEHLKAASAQLADELLRAAPALRILATSREPLGITGEMTWRVPALTTPTCLLPATASRVVTKALTFDAVRLFVDRAAASRPGFALTDANVAAVVEICRRLDGIPLAIELAASCLRALTPLEIERRLDERLRLLMLGNGTAIPRHQTVRALVDWSHQLLSEAERLLLRRLAVFSGGWMLEAAEGICSGSDIRRDDVLGLLIRLIDQSLVVPEENGQETRYRLPETIRAYALEKLDDAGEAAVLRRLHAEWSLEFAETADPLLRGPQQLVWCDRLKTEHDNLRAALSWSLAEPHQPSEAPTAAEALSTLARAPEHELGMRLVAALGQFWILRGHYSEARRWIEAALATGDRASPYSRVRVLQVGANFARLTDNEWATALLKKALVLAREIGAERIVPDVLRQLTFIARDYGDYDRARALSDESLAVARRLGDQREIALSLHYQALVAQHEGDYARATALSEESLALLRKLGDTSNVVWVLQHLGVVARDRGDFERAASLLEQSLTLSCDLEPSIGVWARYQLGFVAILAGDWMRASEQLREVLEVATQSGNWRLVAPVLQGLGLMSEARGDDCRAARLLGAADALRERVGLVWWPAQRLRHEQAVMALRARLGDQMFSAMSTEGAWMSLDRAVELALAPIPTVADTPNGSNMEAHAAHARLIKGTLNPSLTPRELEIVTLITHGRSNREIAEDFVLSVRTVERHIENIYAKLGLHGKAARAAVAAYALRHGIV